MSDIQYDSFDYDSLMELPGSPCGDSGINSDDLEERSKSDSPYSSDDNLGSESLRHTEFYVNESHPSKVPEHFDEVEELFAGLKLNSMDSGTIRSHKGTKKVKNYVDREAGRVVVYLSTLGVIRETWARCFEVRKILRTLMVKAEEKDVFMSRDNQIELMERMRTSEVRLPQVFVEGQYLGGEFVKRI
ncbi:GRXCR1 [Lepeophtheirus salmonis]|uniref:GRXCR1 n=1 Tax=Lepeophtheirus salmonis TaxID=72036 RepID=A0A7R8HAF9_LEPSM|nr:GRXCR1 [Lepeophtheirus salmonis]CAF2956038.1 GRXCR1 [Lepeophtheirus salmonis]